MPKQLQWITKPPTKYPLFIFLTLCWVLRSFGDDADEVFGEDEGNALAVDPKLLLAVVEKVAKVDVEHLAVLVDHDVVRVTVTDAQNECGHTIPSAGLGERVNCSLISEGICFVCLCIVLI